MARNSLCTHAQQPWWWATRLSPQQPLEQIPQHIRGLDTDHAFRGGCRHVGLGLRGHDSKQRALVDRENGLDDLQRFLLSQNKGCPCSTSTTLYVKGFYKVGLKITSITLVSRTASSVEASRKNLRLLCNSSLLNFGITSKFQLNLKPFISYSDHKF